MSAKRKPPEPVMIAGFAIDAAESEEHLIENEVTEHPVEKGADITDHARARPIQVTIEGVVTDTPIGVVAALRTSDMLPSEECRARLEKIRDDREPVTIGTSLRVYTNMLLERLEFPRSPEDGDSLRFRVVFRQVFLVTNERTVIRVAIPRAAKKVVIGNKATTPVVTTPKVAPAADTTRPPVRRVPIAAGGSGYAPPGRVLVGTSADRLPIASGGEG